MINVIMVAFWSTLPTWGWRYHASGAPFFSKRQIPNGGAEDFLFRNLGYWFMAGLSLR